MTENRFGPRALCGGGGRRPNTPLHTKGETTCRTRRIESVKISPSCQVSTPITRVCLTLTDRGLLGSFRERSSELITYGSGVQTDFGCLCNVKFVTTRNKKKKKKNGFRIRDVLQTEKCVRVCVCVFKGVNLFPGCRF